jgi:hypothetical protein
MDADTAEDRRAWRIWPRTPELVVCVAARRPLTIWISIVHDFLAPCTTIVSSAQKRRNGFGGIVIIRLKTKKCTEVAACVRLEVWDHLTAVP